jgi:LCP family protein required for cell wall assembly
MGAPRRPQRRRRRPGFSIRGRLESIRLPRPGAGCVLLFVFLGGAVFALISYLLFPVRTKLLILGIDYADPGSTVARSDTIMLVAFNPYTPYVRMLSVPRDLWVVIPGVGENRINTAHFFAESQTPGSGPQSLRDTIALNFGVSMPYYLRIRFEGFREMVDALGGVTIELSEPVAGYPPGKYHLTGNKALAFVRNRTDADDFFRMSNGQLMLEAMLRNMLNPLKWPRLPGVARAFFSAIDTNAPVWIWPRLAMALLRVGPNGIDNRIVTRQMTTSFITDQGAMVLLPKWESIRPMVEEMFGSK